MSQNTVANKNIPTSLFSYAFCKKIDNRNPQNNKEFDDYIKELALLAAPENWGKSNGLKKEHHILHNYIHYTFQKISSDYNNESDINKKYLIIAENETKCCFNTGLFTSRYERIFCLFEKNKVPKRQEWYLMGFFKESDSSLASFNVLPNRAEYFSDPRELIFDYRIPIRPNKDHILGDPENIKRLPRKFQSPESEQLISILFDGAVNIAEKKVSANYKLAIPQYFNGKVQLLIPVCLETDKADIALAIEREGDVYKARTCLTLEMAYNNARLIVRPEVNWLEPDQW